MPYRIEVRDRIGGVLLTESFDGTEMEARQRASDLVQESQSASGHVFDTRNNREVYRIAEKID